MEIYISTDVESNGPIPGVYSMLSFASAAYTKDKKLIATFSVNLNELEGAKQDSKTMEWWKKFPEAWKNCRKDCIAPDIAMKNYYDWLIALPHQPVFVGYPVAFDFMFIYWYLINFVGKSPFSHSAVDIKTMAMMLLKEDYSKISRSNMPKNWFDDLPHTHIALDDAIEQGAFFCNLLNISYAEKS